MFGLSFNVPGVEGLVISGTISEYDQDHFRVDSFEYLSNKLYFSYGYSLELEVTTDGWKYFVVDNKIFNKLGIPYAQPSQVRIIDYIRSTVTEALSVEYYNFADIMKAIIRDGINNVVVDMECDVLDSFGLAMGIGIISSDNPRILAKCRFVESYLRELHTTYKLRIEPITNELIAGDSMIYITGRSFYTHDFISMLQHGTIGLKMYTVPHTDGEPEDHDYTMDYFESHGLRHLFKC